jgi:histone deacetylase 1/2
MLFLDDYSRKVWCYLLKNREEAPTKIQEHVKMIERQKSPMKVALVRTDGAKELTSGALTKFYLDNGIHPELSAPYSQSQNGLSERYMLKLGEAAQAMLAQAGCEQYDWPYAISYAAYLSNITPTKGLNNDITPNEAYDGVHREYKVEGVFGCLCYAKVFVRRKAEPKARRCTYLGCSSVYKAFIVRDVLSFNESKKVFYSRDVRFDITVFPNQNVLVPRPVSFPVDDLVTTSSIVGDVDDDDAAASESDSNISIDLDEDATNQQDELDEKHGSDGEDSCSLAELDLLAECSEGEDEEEPIVTTQSNNRRSARQRTLSSAAMERMVAEEMPEFTYEEEKQAIGNLFLLEDADPTTQGKAYESACAQEWENAEIEEMASIYQHNVGTLVRREKSMNVLGSRFVYKSKRKPDGTIYRWKARLVCQGFKQIEGIDFHETFSSQARLPSIKLLLFLVNLYDLDLFSFDIKTFFLYGDMKEDVFMEQPPGYADASKSALEWVWKLNKTLYGAKQSPREARAVLVREFTRLKLMLMNSEPNVYFIRRCEEVMILVNFVDDTLGGVTKNSSLKPEFLTELRKTFEFEVVEDPDVFLSFEIARQRTQRKLKIHQTGYCGRLLRRFKMEESRAVNVPWTAALTPAPSSVKLESCYEYQELVGALIWLVNTRKDLCFYVNFLCRYMTKYGEAQWKLAIGVLRYLVGTQTMGLMYDMSEVPIPDRWGVGVNMVMWVDSNFAERSYDSKSSSGLILQMNGCTIDAACLLQRRPSQDTAEAEWYGFAAACKWVEWYRGFLSELEIKFDGPTPIRHDNKAVKDLLSDSSKLGRTLHWRIAQAYPRFLFQAGTIVCVWWDGTLMCADMLTKSLQFPRMSRHRRVLMGE